MKDWIWQKIYNEVGEFARREPLLASFLHETILNHNTLEDALSFHLASKLHSANLRGMLIREIFHTAMASDPSIIEAVQKDIEAIYDRDPAAKYYSIAFLYFKGFHALQSQRIANWLWKQDRQILALNFQNTISEVFGVDAHPAAKIGKGILIDHATSVVIGETAVIEDNVSILHEVTLGGTGKETGDRHPKVRSGVLIGAGAKILGNIEIGEGAKVGAGSVVLKDVPPHCTVAGIPARVVCRTKYDKPALEMRHDFPDMDSIPDYLTFEI